MQLIKKRERLGEFAFFAGIIIHILLMTIGYGDFSIPFHGRFMQVAFALFCIKILCTYYTKQEWIVMIILGIVGAISYIYTRDEYVISVIVMIFAAKNIDMQRVCRWILCASFIFTVGIAILSLCGIGGMAVDVRHYGRGSEEARWCLGFGHANNFHGTIWYLVMLVVILYSEKLRWQHYLFMTVGNLALFCFTASRSGLIAVQIVILAAVVLKYVPNIVNAGWIYILGIIEVVGITILSVVSATISSERTPVLSVLDSLLTGRLHLPRWYADISKWRIFSAGGTTEFVDNGWVMIFFSYGYVIGIVFVLFHLYLIYKTWKEKNGVLLILLVTSVFYTFMESSYMLNSAYLLCNLSYIAAMIYMAKTEGQV